MLRHPMNNLLLTPPADCISRKAFQSLFHQAIVTEDSSQCLGLLGSSRLDLHCVQHVVLVPTLKVLDKVMQEWAANHVVCVGLFHLEQAEVPVFLVQAMEDNYLRLAVNLDEKGRLDLLAFVCDKMENKQVAHALDLIEDGQQVSHA